MMNWFDTHIHLSAPEWRESPQRLSVRASNAAIDALLMPGVRVDDWPRLLALAQELTEVYVAPGLHPIYAEQWTAVAATQLAALAGEAEVLAIGEIGLDAVTGSSLDVQERVFREQLQIALEANLPVLLHSRKTTGRVLAILRELNIGRQVGGIWHGFSGSVEVARELVALGFKIGVGPILLRESARRLPQAVVALPNEALVLESDAPDMIEDPLGILRVASSLAELKNWTLEQTARITTANARQVFRQRLISTDG
jgi:TatD DNase family protein